jgi:IclR family pca regulon transcriptional regulator
LSKVEVDEDGTEFVRSLAKGLAVIEAFDADTPNMTLSRVAEKVGLSPGSARRVLVTLTKLGYVGYNQADRRYQLAPRTLQLGYSFLVSQPALNLLQPRLAELSDKLNESCSIMMRDGKEMVCVARATAKRLQRDYMSVGTRFPAHASSTGKILLGMLSEAEFNALYDEDEVLPELTPFTVRKVSKLREQVKSGREQGWAFVDQETAIGIASVAVPLRVGGQIAYGLSTSATLTRESSTFVDLYLPELRAAAEAMERLLEARS